MKELKYVIKFYAKHQGEFSVLGGNFDEKNVVL